MKFLIISCQLNASGKLTKKPLKLVKIIKNLLTRNTFNKRGQNSAFWVSFALLLCEVCGIKISILKAKLPLYTFIQGLSFNKKREGHKNNACGYTE